MVKKFIFLTIIILIILLLYISKQYSSTSEKNDYINKIIFFNNYLNENFDLEERVINDFNDGFYILINKFPEFTKLVSPIEMIAIGFLETTFRNIKGDGGKSLGFFQVQEPTYWFVKHHYREVFETINFTNPWLWKDVEKRADVQLITSILYLHYLKIHHEGKAYFHYNGGSTVYQNNVEKILENLYNEYIEKSGL